MVISLLPPVWRELETNGVPLVFGIGFLLLLLLLLLEAVVVFEE